MKFRSLFACALVASTSLVAMAPSTSYAQSKAELDRRQQKKNEWRNLAYAGGALTLLGLLNKNSTLTTVGVIGALYSANRYEQDRKSQSNLERSRAQLFSRTSFDYGGHHYVRKSVWKNGKKYYTFAKAW